MSRRYDKILDGSGSRRRNEVRPSGRNIKLEIEYDGTDYCGWQVQKSQESGVRSQESIQEVIEKTLRKILQEKIRLIASGRTDAGVHAKAQVANFKTNSDITLEKLQRALNGLLPEGISIIKTEEKPLVFHSRFDAKSKIYRYTILNRHYRSALLKNRVYFYPYPLNFKIMQKEARAILGKHNFKAFQATDKSQGDSLRTIKKFKIAKDNDLIHIDIEADGFLYNMVRNIVGTLIEIGRGKFPQGSLRKIMLSKDRRLAGPTAPSQGLYLVNIKY